jgi:hypothetical protein
LLKEQSIHPILGTLLTNYTKGMVNEDAKTVKTENGPRGLIPQQQP